MNNIKKAIKVFKNGGVVIFPTDTAFGIGCIMNNKESVEKVFEIKQRPKDKAVLVLVDSVDMAQEYLLPIDSYIKEKILKKYWPGGVTVILPCLKNKVTTIVRGEKDTLAIRMPDNKDLLKIITELKIPIIAPSANFSGRKTPLSLKEIDPNFSKLSDFILSGSCKLSGQSTIIDCSVFPFKIIRQGVVKVKL